MRRVLFLMLMLALAISTVAQTYEQKVEKYQAAAKRVKTAIEQGKVSKEQGEFQLLELRKQMFDKKAESSAARSEWVEAYLKGAENALIAAVNAGKMDRIEIEPILTDMRKGVQVRLDPASQKVTTSQQPKTQEEQMKAYLDNVKAEVKAAMEAGEMTEKEGKEKIEKAEKVIQERRETIKEMTKVLR